MITSRETGADRRTMAVNMADVCKISAEVWQTVAFPGVSRAEYRNGNACNWIFGDAWTDLNARCRRNASKPPRNR